MLSLSRLQGSARCILFPRRRYHHDGCKAGASIHTEPLRQQQGVAMDPAASDAVEGRQPDNKRLKRIAVFCGASFGSDPQYTDCAKALGQEMIKRKIGLVYGGGSVGLMSVIATTVADGLGQSSVFGVIPEALKPREISGDTIGEILVVPGTGAQAKMAEAADAFIALPGGYGTMEEIIEMLTWHQLGIHKKPCGFLNIKGFYDHLLHFFDHTVQEGFVREPSRHIAQSDTDPAALIDKLEAFLPQESLLTLLKEGKIDSRLRG